jgi:proteic killer suppression protein
MKIRNVIHKGLRRFIEDDDSRRFVVAFSESPSDPTWLENAPGLQASVVPKLRRMISFLQDMAREDELRSIPSWKAHQLTGDRKGEWSLSVTKNWRLTFRIDQAEIEIINLDYEDYH